MDIITNINCGKIKNLLSEYIDDMLPENEKQAVSEHICFCSECAMRHSQLCALAEELKSLPAEPLPPDFSDKLLHRIDNLKKPSFVTRHAKSFSAAAAGILFFLIIRTGYHYYNINHIKTAYIDDAPIEFQNDVQQNMEVSSGYSEAEINEMQNKIKDTPRQSNQQQSFIGNTSNESEKNRQPQKETREALPQETPQNNLDEEANLPDNATIAGGSTQRPAARIFSHPIESAPIDTAENAPQAASAYTAAGDTFHAITHDNDEAVFVSVKITVSDFSSAAAVLLERYNAKETDGEILLTLDNYNFQQVMNLMLEYGAKVEQKDVNKHLAANECVIVPGNRENEPDYPD